MSLKSRIFRGDFKIKSKKKSPLWELAGDWQNVLLIRSGFLLTS